MLKKSVLRRQFRSNFDTLCNQTTYKKDSKKSGGLLRTSRTATQYLDSGQLLRRQLNCSPTDKKENKNPTLRIFENFFCSAHLAHLPLPQQHKPTAGAKSKEPNLPAHKKTRETNNIFAHSFKQFSKT